MNEHKKINELLTEFILGELSKEQASEVRIHLEKCSECSDEIKRLETLLEHTELIRKSSVDEKTCESAKQAILRTVEQEKIKQQTSRVDNHPELIWRTIMNSRTVKLAAAAVIIIAAILILKNSPVNITSTAFGLDDVITALNKAQWMYSKYEIIGSDTEPNNDNEENDLSGTWFSVNPSRTINIGADGEIIFSESTLGKETVYHPKSNKITITYSGFISKARYSSIADMVMSDISNDEKAGAKLTYTDGFLEGRPVKIINIDTAEASDRIDSNVTMFVDPETRLPIKAKHNRILGQAVNSNVYLVYDFPQQGPTDIYEAGAPRDAKVEVVHGRDNPRFIDKPENPGLTKALTLYKNARENLVSNYTLITSYEYDSIVRMLDVVYKQGQKQRSECYSGRKLVFPDSNNESVENGFEYLLKWSQDQFDKHVKSPQEHKDEYLSVEIYDGRNFSNTVKILNDKWITEGKRYWPDYHRFWGLNDLSDWGWPDIPAKNNVKQIENEYSRENGFLAFESISEPDISDGKLICAAKKEIYYLDPKHDYMCVRKEEFQHFIMGGIEIKDIEFDINEISEELSSVQFVSEFGQTENGRWYPKKIETHSKSRDSNGDEKPLSLSFINTLYLKTNPKFPEGIFDPSKLPMLPNSKATGMIMERKTSKPFVY